MPVSKKKLSLARTTKKKPSKAIIPSRSKTATTAKKVKPKVKRPVRTKAKVAAKKKAKPVLKTASKTTPLATKIKATSNKTTKPKTTLIAHKKVVKKRKQIGNDKGPSIRNKQIKASPAINTPIEHAPGWSEFELEINETEKHTS